MGAVESRHDQTNWDEADGGLAGDVKCMAGQTPTHGHKTITLKKMEMLNHRIFDVSDADGNLIFKFKPTPNSFQWFELTSPHVKQTHPNKGQVELLCRAAKVSEHKRMVENVENYFVGSWTLYSYVHPSFEGQEGDKAGFMESELTAEEVPLYRAYEISFDHVGKSHGVIKPYVADPDGKEKRGVPGAEQYKLEKVKSLTAKQIFQVSLPNEDGLVTFWQWNNTLTEHKIELEVAKGVDLALMSTIAVLCNMVKETEKVPFNVKSAFTS